MSGDGADMGVDAERALDTVLGGASQPTEEEQRTPEQMRAKLMAAHPLADIETRIEQVTNGDLTYQGEVLYSKETEAKLDLSYSTCADTAGRAVLEFLDAHPELADAPIETEFDDDVDWSDTDHIYEHVARRGLYEEMKEHGVSLAPLGLSGFMWGWAYNAAHFARSEPTAPNPAIVTIET